MPSKSFAAFDLNLTDIELLRGFHTQIGGAGPGRKHNVEVLNRAVLVFITACWEAYVEDVAEEGFLHFVSAVPSGVQLPLGIRALIAKKLHDKRDAARIWPTADSTWQATLTAYKADVLANWLESWHTPKSKNVDALFGSLIGLPSVSASWRWKSMNDGRARTKLDKYVTVRGSIAHRVRYTSKVSKEDCTDYLDHVKRLVASTDQAVLTHLTGVCGTSPW